jgi:hypothetical protein
MKSATHSVYFGLVGIGRGPGSQNSGFHIPRPAGAASSCRTESVPVRNRLGRDARNSLARMGPTPGFGRSATEGFGTGSVGRGGSVGPAETAQVSSTSSHRTGLSVVLKIRVSMVDSVPGHHSQAFDSPADYRKNASTRRPQRGGAGEAGNMKLERLVRRQLLGRPAPSGRVVPSPA